MDKAIKILAVDDERFNLLVLQSCLKGERYKLNICEDALRALDEFRKDDYEVILLDIMMQGINGFELRKLIRRINPKVPIIFLSAIVDDIDNTLMDEITSDPYSYYLKKPISALPLRNSIEQVVGDYRGMREAASYYQKLEDTLSLAEDVQMAMLPNWCACEESMLFSFFFAPSMKVSGDIICRERVGDNRELIFIGDISGHGIQAALYTSAIQSFIKMLLFNAKEEVPPPHEVLNRLNQFFRNDLAAESYMTCVVAFFDFENNTVTYHSAGHPAILRCGRDGRVGELSVDDCGGLPVGMQNDRYLAEEDQIQHFRDDEVFLFFTDGVWDVANSDGEVMDEATFRLLLGSLVMESGVVAIPFQIRSALAQIGYTENPDDICIAAAGKYSGGGNLMVKVLRASTAEASRVAEELSNFVLARSGDQDYAARLELLVSEFLNNIIIHGTNSRKHSQTGIFVRLTVLERELELCVIDRSREWNYSPPDSEEAYLDQRNRTGASSGRGMAIIHNVSSSIRRNHYAGMNETIFKIEQR